MVNPSDFTGTPFVMGSIFGERCFDVVGGGVLSSPAMTVEWVSGENVATCKRRDHWGLPNPVTQRPYQDMVKALEMLWPDRWVVRISAAPGQPDSLEVHWKSKNKQIVAVYDPGHAAWVAGEEKPETFIDTVEIHPEGTDVISVPYLIEVMDSPEFDPHKFSECTCGFYAYLTGAEQYYSKDRVVAIIEGYGETLIGKKGFRCQKAKIVALAPSPGRNQPEDPLIAAIMQSFNSPVRGTPTPPPVVVRGNQWQVNHIAPASSGTHGVLMLPRRYGKTAMMDNLRTQRKIKQQKNTINKVTWKMIAKRYPDAVIFKSPEKMLKEFPVTPLEEIL